MDTWLSSLEEGALTRGGLVERIVESEEFARLRALEEAARGNGGVFGDARLVEIPWMLARYGGADRVLDVGYAHAAAPYLEALAALGARDLVGVDLAYRPVPGMRGVQADVRALPFAASSFDLILCVSTLEHIGRDNSVYGLTAEIDESGMARALREFRRVLDRDGRLLVSVPCGEHEDHGWFLQLEPEAWLDLFRRAGFAVAEQSANVLGDSGWQNAEHVPRGLAWGTRGPGASAVLCVDLRRGP